MKSRTTWTSVLILALIACIGAGWWLFNRPQDTTNDGVLPGTEPSVEEGDSVGDDMETSTKESAREPLSSKRREIVSSAGRKSEAAHQPDPFSEGTRLIEIFDEAMSLYGWTERELRGNQAQWGHYCEQVEPYADKSIDIEKLSRMLPGAQTLVNFASVCGDFVEDVELQERDLASSRPEETVSPLEHQDWIRERKRIREMHQAGAIEDARELAIQRLDHALRRLDENDVHGALGDMIIGGAELISPPIADDQATYGYYLAVMTSVGSALICSELGGCRGEQHPMVLRQCVSSIERNQGCYQPENIIDAIYQTHTPVEYMAFIAFYDQVTSLLAAYRQG